MRIAAILIAVLVLALAGCGSDLAADRPTELIDGDFRPDWAGIIPDGDAPWRACDELTLAEGGLALSWGGDGCAEPALAGVEHEGCAYYPGEGYLWWVCPDWDDPSHVGGERHVAGQIVDHFFADLVE